MDQLNFWVPTFTAGVNATAGTFLNRGGMWFRGGQEPGLFEIFGNINITMTGTGISTWSFSLPPGVGELQTLTDAWGHATYDTGAGSAELYTLEGFGADQILAIGTSTTGATRAVGINAYIYTSG